MSGAKKFLIVDDDPINNMLCKLSIKRAFPDAEILAFENPLEALVYIQSTYPIPGNIKTRLLLDINMPELSGWDFLPELRKFGPETVNQFDIYIASSSVDGRDQAKAEAEQDVQGFISKPVKEDILLEMVG